MSTRVTISDELREVEHDIDTAYRTNPLSTMSFAEAAWYFLAYCEERSFRHLEFGREPSEYNTSCFVDNLVNDMKNPLKWIKESCVPAGNIPRAFSGEAYQASIEMGQLADQYSSFETAFTYASAGIDKLVLDGDTVSVSGRSFKDESRYEAYDRLLLQDRPSKTPTLGNVLSHLASSISIHGERFTYPLKANLLRATVDDLAPIFDEQFWLPAEWQLPRYTFGEFRQVTSVLRAWGMIHCFARAFAARQGCPALGYSSSVLTVTSVDLLTRIRACTGLPNKIIASIIDDLTYGERGIRSLDPALQPLIRLTNNFLAIPSALLMSSNFERNLTVLINRLPEERSAYSRLSTEREDISRSRITKAIKGSAIRLQKGRIPSRPDLPDIDLALIDDTDRTCLILELKAFFAPAEPREIAEKSEEIENGVSQCKKLKEASVEARHAFNRLLGIEDDYLLNFAVSSETFIGTSNVQDETVPVVRTSHLLKKLLSARSLRTVCDWLTTRNYLPQEGRHFELKETISQIAKWKLRWYVIVPLDVLN